MKNGFLATAAVLLVACAGNSQSGPPGRPALEGSWVLNEKDSQNPLTLVGGGAGGFGTAGRGTTEGDAPPGRGGFGGEGGFGGGRSGGRSGGRNAGQLATSRAKVNAVQQKLEVLTDMHRRMTITQKGSALNIAYAIGPQMSYRIGGKAGPDTVPVLGVVRSHTEWKDGVFILRQKIGDLDMKEEFTRNIGSKRLVVYTSVDGLSRPLQYRRVYDPQ